MSQCLVWGKFYSWLWDLSSFYISTLYVSVNVTFTGNYDNNLDNQLLNLTLFDIVKSGIYQSVLTALYFTRQGFTLFFPLSLFQNGYSMQIYTLHF